MNSRNRATIDVMRSIAHELTHHKQYEQGRLKVKPPDIGGEIEDEANAKAGQYIKIFAKKFPEIYEIDEQSFGNISKNLTLIYHQVHHQVHHQIVPQKDTQKLVTGKAVLLEVPIIKLEIQNGLILLDQK